MKFSKKIFEVKKILQSYNIRCISKYNNTLNNIIRSGKDKTTIDNSTEIVYKICCTNCPAVYIGQTKRALKNRINEHKKCSNPDSVISQHINKFNHIFHWDKIKILDKESNLKKRLLSEMLYINSTDYTINKIEDTQELNNVYKNISII